MIINHNIAALNTHRQLSSASSAQSNSMEKLASGMRINKAGDDAAGLAVSEKMRGQIRGLDMASKNAQDGISMIQTAEGALNETHDILQRMRELAVQSSNDTNTDDDRAELQKEVDQLAEELTRISTDTEFNTKKLINGDADGENGGASLTFHIGANESQSITLNIKDMGAAALNVAAEGVRGEVTADGLVYTNADGEEATATFQAAVTATATTVEEEVDVDGNVTTPASSTISYTPAGEEDAVEATWQAADEDAGTVAGYYNEDDELVLAGPMLDDEAEETVSQAGYYAEAELVHAAAQELNVGDKVEPQGGINVSTQTAANTAITTINDAIKTVSTERSKLGAYQNRLDHTINNLSTSSENLTAAESRIRDVDMAKEMMNQTKNSILSQAAQAMLAQSNQMPQGVLQLLR